MARSTADTVGMYTVLFLASSHVSPISWQSRPSIRRARSPPATSRLTFPFSCTNTRTQVRDMKIYEEEDTAFNVLHASNVLAAKDFVAKLVLDYV
uniref:Uncharacterized protein n=1 Tax=Oryza meridionalis TaxID=40149 RepID=A0A0E0ED18_9ORYZ